MGCGKCDRYSRALLRCLDGKVNPKTKKGTKQVMSVMGVSAVCTQSKWKRKAYTELMNNI